MESKSQTAGAPASKKAKSTKKIRSNALPGKPAKPVKIDDLDDLNEVNEVNEMNEVDEINEMDDLNKLNEVDEMDEVDEMSGIIDDEDPRDEDSEGDSYFNDPRFNETSRSRFADKYNIHLLDPTYHLQTNSVKEVYEVPRDLRESSDKMTDAEATRLISERAQQIANGAVPYVDIGKEYDPIRIAEKELRAGKSPLVIIRHYNGGLVCEKWPARDMILPFGM
jgi:DNA-directed RNA polymerase subunit K/omega